MAYAVVRRPAGMDGVTLNFFRHLVPPVARIARAGIVRKVEHWLEASLTAYGNAELVNSAAAMSVAHAEAAALHTAWVPVHDFLLRHKTAADTTAFAFDIVGVLAGVGLLFTFSTVAGAVAAVGIVGMVTGTMAATGSALLTFVDGIILFGDLSDDEDLVKIGEDTRFSQWLRILGTGLLLPDIPMGGPRALAEFSKLVAEARESAIKGPEAFAKSQRNRELAQNMRRPALHARAIQRHQYRAKRLAAEAKAAARSVKSAHYQMVTTLTRDANASFIASPGSLALLGGLPPDMLSPKSSATRSDLLSPDNPTATNVRIEIRVSTNRRVVP